MQRMNSKWWSTLAVVAALVLAAGILGLAWVGFIGSDDWEYYAAGQGLAASPVEAPGGFGGMRLGITLPVALALKGLGDQEWVIVLPSLIYALGIVAVTVLGLARFTGAGVALVTAILFVSLPVVATSGTMVSADIAELFWAVSAFWLALAALRAQGSGQAWLAVLSGGAIALAFASRETAAAMVPWLGLGFLLGFGMERRVYLWFAAGFLAVFAVEIAFFWVSTGDPLVRFEALLGTRSADTRMPVAAGGYDDSGALRVAPWIDPLVLLFTKHSFGLLYWLLLALGLGALVSRRGATPMDPDGRRALIATLVLALVWALFTAYMLARLRLNARYYMAPSYFLMVAAALWYGLKTQSWPSRRVMTLGALALWASALAGIWAEDRDPRFNERALADMALSQNETIYTDAASLGIGKVYLAWRGGDPARLSGDPPPPGALRFRALGGIGARHRGEDRAPDLGEAVLVEVRRTPPRIGGPLGGLIQGATWIPSPIRAKLTQSRSEAQVLRVGSLGETPSQ